MGVGESAHGTHTQLRLKHRVARYLVEDLGFRTTAWEEGRVSGVAIDRYGQRDDHQQICVSPRIEQSSAPAEPQVAQGHLVAHTSSPPAPGSASTYLGSPT